MVCGYIEPEYSVEKTATAQVGMTTQLMELRVAVPPEPNTGLEEYFAKYPERRPPSEDADSRRYISIVGTTPDGQAAYDVLLNYKQASEEKVDSDWAQLVANPSVRLNDLDGWCERVMWHGTGYLRENGVDAGARMY